jgi:cob(I)alamin adenosyltransferase
LRNSSGGVSPSDCGSFIIFLAAALWPPHPQDPAYHNFADRRAVLHIPYALNVLSNVGFLLAGTWAFRRTARSALAGWERVAGFVFAAAGLLGRAADVLAKGERARSELMPALAQALTECGNFLDADAAVVKAYLAERAHAEQHYADAAALFRELAEGGSAIGQLRLAQLYEHGQGVLQSFVEAVRWYREAAGQGSIPAQSRLGEIYLTGLEAPATATASAVARIQSNDAEGSLLSRMFPAGLAVRREPEQAAEWNLAAARGGDIAAKARLGYQYAAALGVVRVTANDQFIADEILAIQKELILVMGELATAPEDLPRYKKDGYQITSSTMVDRLTALVDDLEKNKLQHFKGWAIPGSTPAAAALDVARTTCRRAERRVATLGESVNAEILRYLNRLSDLCWLLARYVEHTKD